MQISGSKWTYGCEESTLSAVRPSGGEWSRRMRHRRVPAHYVRQADRTRAWAVRTPVAPASRALQRSRLGDQCAPPCRQLLVWYTPQRDDHHQPRRGRCGRSRRAASADPSTGWEYPARPRAPPVPRLRLVPQLRVRQRLPSCRELVGVDPQQAAYGGRNSAAECTHARSLQSGKQRLLLGQRGGVTGNDPLRECRARPEPMRHGAQVPQLSIAANRQTCRSNACRGHAIIDRDEARMAQRHPVRGEGTPSSGTSSSSGPESRRAARPPGQNAVAGRRAARRRVRR